MGLQRGDRVATLMWSHNRHLEAYFGIPLAGGVLHTLNLRLHPKEIARIATHAQDRFVIVDDVLLPLWEQIAADFKPERVIVVSISGKPPSHAYEDYEAWLESYQTPLSPLDIDENEAAGLCYTSGTTGVPKGVLYSHRALVLHSFAISLPDTLGLRQTDVVMPVVPMFHVNAWGLPFAAAMLGIKQVLPGPFLDPQSLLELIVSERVTFSSGVPTIWLGMLREIEARPEAWNFVPGLRMLVGGAAVPESMIRGYHKHGIRIIQGWGMTETSPLGTISYLKSHMEDWPDDARFATLAKQGLPAPLIEIRTVNAQGVCPCDGQTMGELQIRGAWVASGYFGSDAESDKWTTDGWFRTGDVATIDAEGYMRITDRVKDLIKSGGEWISSVDLENALMAHPAVQEAAVIAVPDPKWQERPLAVVVLKECAGAEPEALRAHLADRFPKWWLPDQFVFVKEIPRTSTGKFLKTKLRELYGKT
ncbi:MAG: long-chain fatty acid--CoA ligase, partial [Acidobacteria bacterium]|nr:long-chain fatty acid--CoA ligase [Acidobacteriota bacterium]